MFEGSRVGARGFGRCALRSLGLVLSATLICGLVEPVQHVDAAGGVTLTVNPITWDMMGLDSNNVNVGPNVFPVGVKVCNTGSSKSRR